MRVDDWMIFFREKTKRKLVYRLSRSRVSSSLSASPLSTTSVAKRDATFAAVNAGRHHHHTISQQQQQRAPAWGNMPSLGGTRKASWARAANSDEDDD